jgi:hypothetical protein
MSLSYITIKYAMLGIWKRRCLKIKNEYYLFHFRNLAAFFRGKCWDAEGGPQAVKM